MAGLWDAGVRDLALDAVSAWKEVLLALALGAIVWRHRGIPFKSTSTDWLALAYAAFVLLYAVDPAGLARRRRDGARRPLRRSATT